MESSPRQFQRTYKACITCRKRKARCKLDLDGRPPCARCRRQHKDCVFSDIRNKRGRSEMEEGSAESDRLNASTADLRERPVFHSPPEDSCYPMQIRSEANALPFDDEQLANATTNPQYDVNGISHSNSDRPEQEAPSNSALGSLVMRTVVSTGNDALNILFEAASHDANPILSNSNTFVHNTTAGQIGSMEASSNITQPDISQPGLETVALWGTCRFVTMGWLSAKDAVTYVDLFFQNMWPLSPIITDFYAAYDHHRQLISQEPMLCCTILLISSRYHVLPGLAGLSKSYFLHNRLWKHWQNLLMRVMFGQEKSPETSMRTVGTIESLLMMSEWHPRSIHFPPEGDGWDSDLILSTPDQRNQAEEDSPSNQWVEEVVRPCRRSDQMSWMLLGSALTLAHKLGIFDSQSRWSKSPLSGESPNTNNHLLRRGLRIQKLLYVYINQLASRLGCTSLLPQSLTLAGVERTFSTDAEDQWDYFMSAWIALTKLLKSVSDVFFPSTASTRHHLLSGRYIGLLDHFKPLLAQWRVKHLDSNNLKDTLQEILFIEYQYVKIFMNSLGIQAVVERSLIDSTLGGALEDDQLIDIGDADYEFIQEVISGSCKILGKVTNLAQSGALRFAPVRFYLRITTSSVFLLKALGLGVWNAQLKTSLDTLDKSIQALKSCTLDDMHLAPRYASLLEPQVARLRQHFIVSSRRTHLNRATARHVPTERSWIPMSTYAEPATQTAQDLIPSSMPINFALEDISGDDWLSLPFDPSMAPFGLDGNQVFPGLEEGALDFVWNLPV